MHSSSSSGGAPGGGSGPGSSSAPGSDFVLLSQQPYAVADPSAAFSGIIRGISSGTAATAASSSSSSGWVVRRPQHVEGGLFLCAALMGSSAAAGTSRQDSWPHAPANNSIPASPAASSSVTGLLEVSPVGALVPSSGSGAFGSGSGTWSAAGNGPGSQQQQQQQAGLLDLHRTSSGLTYSYTAGHAAGSPSGAAGTAAPGSTGVRYGQHHAGGPLSSISGQQQQQQLSGVRVSRTLLVVWLRAALDVLAALTHVDPAAVLMELSHKLAGVWGGGMS